ncbi:MAG: hypothetical protein J5855_10215 [Mailhella sp.]|nr:hypothetical protein [Mailhella sp.]
MEPAGSKLLTYLVMAGIFGAVCLVLRILYGPKGLLRKSLAETGGGPDRDAEGRQKQ